MLVLVVSIATTGVVVTVEAGEATSAESCAKLT